MFLFSRGILLFLLFLIYKSFSQDSVFWHISDFHLNNKYFDMKDCYENHPFANYLCDSSVLLVKSALEFLKNETSKEKPVFISLTGDDGPHLDDLTREFTFQTITNLIKYYNEAIDPTIPFIPVVGNHDVFPANKMSPDPKDEFSSIAWCKDLENIWQKFIIDDGQPQSDFKKGCYFSRYLKDRKLLITSINGLIWYANNPLAKPKEGQSIEDYDPLGQFAWLESLYMWARENHVKVVNTNHFPLTVAAADPEKFKNMYDLPNKKFVDLIRRYKDIILVNLVAHEHVDSFRLVLDPKNQIAESMFLLAPSVSPFHFHDFGAFNPRLRKFVFNSITNKIINYHQYILNISSPESINQGWKYDYNFLERYNKTILSPETLLEIVNDFEKYEDYQHTWSQYWNSELGYTHREGSCANVPSKDSFCRCKHICAFKYADFEDLNLCLDKCDAQNIIISGRIIFAIILSVIVVVAVILLAIINKRRRNDNLENDSMPIVHEEI